MTWVLFAIGLNWALLGLNAHFPIRTPTWISIWSFFAGWLTSELAVWHLVVVAPAVVAFALLGGAAKTPGQIGIGLAVFGLSLIAIAIKRSRDAKRAMRDALEPVLVEPDPQPFPFFLAPLASSPGVECERDVVYHEDGRLRLRLDVYRSADRRERAPILIQIHGGAWMVGSKREQGLPMVRHMASRGWLCLNVDYRLSPRATFPDPLVDLKRAIVWARKNAERLGGDADFIVVTGGSAGGHLASMVALTANDPAYQPGFEGEDTTVQGCVPFYGVYDFTSRRGIRRDAIARAIIERFVMKQRLDDAPEAYERASPILRVRDERASFLVVHGSCDSLAIVEEARAFVARLRETSKKPALYAEIPGAQHAFDVFASIRTQLVLRGVARFLGWLHSDHLATRDTRAADRAA
jgi:acetyl esterase/lipase